ncbi:bacterial DNA polymerase III alpha subunit domain-containing protein [Ditylenchus destructor]|nr:bacterial DNA polymerase III alpha subunit domain-containing protein [Ditylenchus destructor]
MPTTRSACCACARPARRPPSRWFAVGDATMHKRSRKPLQDVLTATRLGKPLSECGQALDRNAERHLRAQRPARAGLPRRAAGRDAARGRTLRFQPRRAALSLSVRGRAGRRDARQPSAPPDLRRSGPALAAGHAGRGRRADRTRARADRGAALRALLPHRRRHRPLRALAGHPVPGPRQRGQFHRLLLHRRHRGRSGAMQVLFERFISKERNEPPDIDIDFEHERREEVIQYLYTKYTRERAALAAVVISYRVKSALRDVGKALGFELETLDRLTSNHQWWDGQTIDAERLRESGLDAKTTWRCGSWSRSPRSCSASAPPVAASGRVRADAGTADAHGAGGERVHARPHGDRVGQGRPRRGGAAQGRRAGAGHATAIRKTLDFAGKRQRAPFEVKDIPDGDVETYDMIQRAETIGVFQIESRAQRSMLPRLRPETFYDLVIEVAIVRPGPIQGGMVHPICSGARCAGGASLSSTRKGWRRCSIARWAFRCSRNR